MSLKIITHWEEGLGTVAKGIMADTQDDYAILHAVMLDVANSWPHCRVPESLRKLQEQLRKNPPAPSANQEEHF